MARQWDTLLLCLYFLSWKPGRGSNQLMFHLCCLLHTYLSFTTRPIGFLWMVIFSYKAHTGEVVKGPSLWFLRVLSPESSVHHAWSLDSMPSSDTGACVAQGLIWIQFYLSSISSFLSCFFLIPSFFPSSPFYPVSLLSSLPFFLPLPSFASSLLFFFILALTI